ncbi:alpha/beta hydrolase family protein [Deinococcus sp.]|uniref:alpha/beta hydrolase family protein n=1 Tax=Deinococcus sp. TaxID=47478 RepID=UPI003CC5E58F
MLLSITPAPFISYSPLVLPAPGRAVNLELKVSYPATGQHLPVILLSHGHGNSNDLSSLRGYGPLADFWAANGFVVIQPTHLDSRALGLRDAPGGPLYWRSRAEDMTHILDQLGVIEASVPGLAGRLDHSRVAAAGHSLGGQTVALLLGMRVTDDGTPVNLADARIGAGVLLAAPGGGADLSAAAAQRYPVLHHNSFAEMTTPALIVAGDQDLNPAFSSRADWRSDAYSLSPGPKFLLTLFGAEHGLGGVAGYDAAETTDANSERVALIQRLTWAYLRSALYPEDRAWDVARAALEASAEPLGRVEGK